jgi:peroxiredoxin
MAMSRFHRISLFIVAVIVTIGVAYILGVAAAGIVQDYRAKKWRAEKTKEVLEQMGSGLAVGVPLPDVELEDMTENPVKLSQVVGPRSMVSFVSPDCGACKIAMERLKKIASDREQTCFIMISSSDPIELTSLRDSLGLNCIWLYDRDNEYGHELGVFSFPFNVTVNKSLIIEDVILGAPEEGQFEDIIEFNRG